MTMRSERHGHEVYVFKDNDLVYKAWINPDGTRKHYSYLFNRMATGWPDQQIIMIENNFLTLRSRRRIKTLLNTVKRRFSDAA